MCTNGVDDRDQAGGWVAAAERLTRPQAAAVELAMRADMALTPLTTLELLCSYGYPVRESWLEERACQCAWRAAGAADAAYAWSDAAIALARVAEGRMTPELALEVWQPLIASVPDLAVPARLRTTPDRG